MYHFPYYSAIILFQDRAVNSNICLKTNQTVIIIGATGFSYILFTDVSFLRLLVLVVPSFGFFGIKQENMVIRITKAAAIPIMTFLFIETPSLKRLFMYYFNYNIKVSNFKAKIGQQRKFFNTTLLYRASIINRKKIF